jgi:septal ring factor EnvC (AmiA/AmiB activator)
MIVLRTNQGTHRRRAIAAAFGIAVPLGLGGAALAQSGAMVVRLAQAAKSPAQKPSAKLDALQQHDKELAAVRAEQQKATESEAKLRREIESLGTDRRKLNDQLIATAGRVRTAEAGIAATEERLRPLGDSEQSIRKSLESRRTTIAEVLAALQRIGRRPPPALLVRPDDALRSLRSAMMLGAILPEMRQEASALATDLTELVRLRKEIAAEHDRLQHEVATLSEERQRLTLLTQERQKQQANTEAALTAARKKAVSLAHDADSLKDLIAKLEQGLDSATRAARTATRAKEDGGAGGIADTGRLQPAIAFASAKGTLSLPVNGVRLREYGAPDGVGGVEKGLSIATRNRAQVTAPCDGWVVYAGPFRSYGQLLILNAGGGYHVLLAGMDRVSVDIGQFVLTGEPVALMGSGAKVAAILAAGSSQPILYVEFRKDGTPIDPSPWWATSEGEKARG